MAHKSLSFLLQYQHCITSELFYVFRSRLAKEKHVERKRQAKIGERTVGSVYFRYRYLSVFTTVMIISFLSPCTEMYCFSIFFPWKVVGSM